MVSADTKQTRRPWPSERDTAQIRKGTCRLHLIVVTEVAAGGSLFIWGSDSEWKNSSTSKPAPNGPPSFHSLCSYSVFGDSLEVSYSKKPSCFGLGAGSCSHRTQEFLLSKPVSLLWSVSSSNLPTPSKKKAERQLLFFVCLVHSLPQSTSSTNERTSRPNRPVDGWTNRLGFGWPAWASPH